MIAFDGLTGTFAVAVAAALAGAGVALAFVGRARRRLAAQLKALRRLRLESARPAPGAATQPTASAAPAADSRGQLRDDSEQLRRLVDSVTDYAVYLLDVDGRVTTWNTGAERIKGYTRDEIIGQHFSVFFPPEDVVRGLPQRALDTARAEGICHTSAWRVRSNGSRFFAEITIHPVLDEAGVLVGFSKITRDVTQQRAVQRARLEADRQRMVAEERQKAAEALRRVNETLAAVLSASPLAIVSLDVKGFIESWNAAAETIFGASAGTAIGRHYSAVGLLDSAGPARCSADEWFASARGASPRFGLELRREAADGALLDLQIASAPLFGDDRQQRGVVLVIEDVTQRKALAAQLRQAQKMDALGQLTGGIAHDFNNLLSIVICNLELLQADLQFSPAMRELCGAAIEASLRGAELVSQMLAYARKQSLEPRVVEINRLVADTLRLLRRALGEHIEIVEDPGHALGRVLIDPVQFQTALTNLATNARDAMPAGGRFTVQTRAVIVDALSAQMSDIPPGDYVMLAATDTGSGMSREVCERAFDPFFTTKRIGHGTGLGLSMVFGFVRQSGGHVRLYSELGHGTTVKLYLPGSAAPLQDEAAAHGHARARPAPSGRRILVVEDNPALARAVESILADAGYVPTAAPSGREALDLLAAAGRFDVLFTDIVMPGGINGVELAREAQARCPGLKVLFTSGFADTAIVAGATGQIPQLLLSKPYRKTELLEKLAQIL